jgi:hypothetical protein
MNVIYELCYTSSFVFLYTFELWKSLQKQASVAIHLLILFFDCLCVPSNHFICSLELCSLCSVLLAIFQLRSCLLGVFISSIYDWLDCLLCSVCQYVTHEHPQQVIAFFLEILCANFHLFLWYFLKNIHGCVSSCLFMFNAGVWFAFILKSLTCLHPAREQASKCADRLPPPALSSSVEAMISIWFVSLCSKGSYSDHVIYYWGATGMNLSHTFLKDVKWKLLTKTVIFFSKTSSNYSALILCLSDLFLYIVECMKLMFTTSSAAIE